MYSLRSTEDREHALILEAERMTDLAALLYSNAAPEDREHVDTFEASNDRFQRCTATQHRGP